MNYFVANWKMNMDASNVLAWVEGFANGDSTKKIIVAPSFIHLPLLTGVKTLEISAQDVSLQEKGSHTGEIGILQLKDFCKYCIVGHSERKETHETVIKKRDMCLENNLTPIVCFTNPQEAAKYFSQGAILAWEDPENISVNGDFKPKNTQQIYTGIEKIREYLPKEALLLYGGSVNRKNIKELKNISNLSGVLVGSASLEPKHFMDIIAS